MGRLLSLLRGVESSIRSRLGSWMQEVSLAGDQIPGIQANVVQLQVDVTAPGWLAAYLTQTAWYVNSATGNDANDASVGAPIETLAELERRWNGRTFSPAVTAVTVNLAGTFPTEGLYLGATFTSQTDPAVVTIAGTMTQVADGTVTAYSTWNSAGDVRGALTDGAQNFTAHIRRRIRITSGGALGSVTRIGSLGGGVTVANVGQFRTGTGFNGTNVNPAVNDTYVVETFDTAIREYRFTCSGAQVFLRDVAISPSANKIGTCDSRQVRLQLKVFGCDYIGPSGGQIIIQGDHTLLSSAHFGTNTEFTGGGFVNTKGLCAFGDISLDFVMMQADSSMHDGNGSTSPSLRLDQGASLLDQTFRAFFGCTAGSQGALIRVAHFCMLSIHTSCYLWGAAGNLTTVALSVGNGGTVYYTTGFKPKATGATPGNDVVLSGAAPIAWAAVPAAAVPPDNAVVALLI